MTELEVLIKLFVVSILIGYFTALVKKAVSKGG
jgi:hypothetical protein